MSRAASCSVYIQQSLAAGRAGGRPYGRFGKARVGVGKSTQMHDIISILDCRPRSICVQSIEHSVSQEPVVCNVLTVIWKVVRPKGDPTKNIERSISQEPAICKVLNVIRKVLRPKGDQKKGQSPNLVSRYRQDPVRIVLPRRL